jgi:hypothetical protein
MRVGGGPHLSRQKTRIPTVICYALADFRLPLESPPRGCVGQVAGKWLDCHRTVKLGIERPVDGANTAVAKARDDLAGAEFFARLEFHAGATWGFNQCI